MDTADHVLIPLLDGTHALAQIARIQYERLLVYVTHSQTTPAAVAKPISRKQVLAVFCIRAGSLPDGHWPITGYDAIPQLSSFEKKHLSEFKVHEPAIVEAFANAVHGLYPWDGFPDKDLFTNMLLRPDVLPTKARMNADFPKPESS